MFIECKISNKELKKLLHEQLPKCIALPITWIFEDAFIIETDDREKLESSIDEIRRFMSYRKIEYHLSGIITRSKIMGGAYIEETPN